MAHNNTLSLVALAVAAGLASPVFAADKKADDVMVVSGSRMEQKLEDVSGPISVITAEQIEEQVVSNVADLFRYEPGVTALGGAGDAQTFIIRGMGENRVKIVRDGVRENDAYKNGGVGQSYFDTDMIKQVEVVKGPASAAYGSDALGGVIAITTKDAADFLKGRDSYLDATSGYASSSHQKMAGFTGALRTGELENLLRYTWRDGGVTQNYDSDKNEFDIVSQAVLFKSQWNLSDSQFLKLTVDYFTEGQDPDAVDLTKAGSVFNQPITDKDTDNLSLVLDHGIALQAPWVDRIDSKIYYARTKQTMDQYASSKYPVRPTNPYVTKNSLDHNGFEQKSLGAQVKFSKALDSQRLAWGLEYEHTDNERTRFKAPTVAGDFEGYSELSFPSTTTEHGALWAFDELKFGERWVLTPGARYDYYRMNPDQDPAYTGENLKRFSEGEFSPKLGLVFKAHEAANLFAQYSHGYKTPMYDNAFSTLNHQAYGYRIEPNTNLKPESSDGIDLGVRGSAGGFSYEVATFYNKYDDFIELGQVSTEGRTAVYQYQNLDKATTKGAEAKADYWLNDLVNVWGNLSYIEGKDGDGNYINSLSPLKGTLGVRLEQANWNINTALRFADDMSKVGKDAKGNDNIKSAGWGVVDIYAQFKPVQDLQFNVGVFNLFDKEYVNYESITGQSASASTSNKTEPGRNLSARVKYVF
ncbi:TonB-dependent hemoglobin/transferrin/lactoferrin family receptor [Aeromonas dhakensis]|uniref:TonB-dependent hemoglobin/transferrin/lactoferrin family receptor n=1 Tax=Aeromonas dhakensis TaxID=196024 RepID=UPI001B3A15F9|nr:TonB-dependent hemoglobin/transferrin/lactoferrin family receptor [Aeromonas dhakensis]MBQ4673715.1 TonB-dependent hemoglobin/transferrin/lactoferrin family receptor [Aeromonas dhakensis]MDX7832302.1 TonB-dependent hemoglobin/transferrin/lactoferrin family receptor [Aeromonas dhakensis]WAF67024.1 TonB-dependent hemoglobin/transferrin/lactoferrin family receptor [Aeromonas dhakensis]CAB5668999.1 Heme/hemopexin utilization protein C precursor [Aeromonas hydrophila]